MKRIIALILALLMVISCAVLVGCGDEKTPDDTPKQSEKPQESKETPGESQPADSGSESADSDSGTTPGKEARYRADGVTEILDDLDLSYNLNRTFTVVGYDDNVMIKDMDQYDATDVIQRSVFDRQIEMRNRYNVTLATVPTQDDLCADLATVVGNEVGSGVHEYDMAVGHTKFCGGMALQGYLYDMASLEAIDFSKDYWNPSFTNDWSYKGKTWWTNGDIHSKLISLMMCIVMNNSLWEKYNTGIDVYEVVENGDWTYENVTSYIANVLEDKNGDGDLGNKGDVFGMSLGNGWSRSSLAYAGGFSTTSAASKTKQKIDLATEENERIYAALVKLVNNKSFARVYNENETFFEDGLVMMYVRTLGGVGDYGSSCDFGYSILPLPKSQKSDSYRTPTYDGVPCVGVSASIANLPANEQQDIGIIMEAMASAGRSFVTEGYYEVSLRLKATQDAGSYRCMEIIRRSGWGDFGFAWCQVISGIDTFVGDAAGQGVPTVAAAAESEIEKFEKSLTYLYANLGKL